MNQADKMVNRIHQTCKNFEQRWKRWDEYDVDIYDKCTKGHDLWETSAKECDDYSLERNPLLWAEPIIDYTPEEVKR